MSVIAPAASRMTATMERSVDGETMGAPDFLERDRPRLERREDFFERAMIRPPR
jgi:hypothetical protein